MNKFLRHAGYLLTVHVSALLVFGLLRAVLFAVIPYEFGSDITLAMKATAFVRGVWFDNVIACYILLLPLVVLGISSLTKSSGRYERKFCTWFFAIFYTVAFLVAGANVPYFCYFFQNINASIFQWFEFMGTTLGMLLQERSYWGIAALLIVLLLLWYKWLGVCDKLWRASKISEAASSGRKPQYVQLLATACCVAAMIGLCMFGIRGRVGYNPIKVSQAYFCQDAFLNQLGVNPVFNLLTSYLDSRRKENRRLALMPDEDAVVMAQQFLQRKGIAQISPIARKVRTTPTKYTDRNVVLILMESMSASLMHSLDRNADKAAITPFLDSLYHESWAFKNMYSAGNHTNHGMFATLYSWPAIMFRNLMKGTVIPHYSGLPTVLHDNGYRNFFFMTHESQYDNMNAFFRTNGFDEIYAQENYPAEKVVNSFGVQDDFLYSFAIPKFTQQSQTGQPFFGVLLSISNHPPFVIPPYFTPKSSLPEEQIVEYADWSIRQFFEAARKEPWFEKTLFVLLADHGKLMPSPESELPQSYNHIPLMIYDPVAQEGFVREDSSWGVQEDVAPTLLSMLGIDYTQNNFGIDLSNETRQAVFYTGDKIVAARDSSHLYLYNPSEEQEICYNVTGVNAVQKADVTASNDSGFMQLRNYVFSMLQTAEVLMGEKKTVTNPE